MTSDRRVKAARADAPILVFRDDVHATYGYSTGGPYVLSFTEASRKDQFSFTCPFCKIECVAERDATNYGGSAWQEDWFAACPLCGWWCFKSDQDDLSGEPTVFSARAILHKFAVSDLDVPMEALVAHVAAHPDAIGAMHPKKFEELVAAIYSEALGHRVEYCSYGRHDRGIDLVVVGGSADRPIAIQAKRWKRPIELGMIHQFLGAIIDSELREGVFITSGRFRSGALATADRVSHHTGIRIGLMDGKRLLDFIGIMNESRRVPTARDCKYWHMGPYWGTTPGA